MVRPDVEFRLLSCRPCSKGVNISVFPRPDGHNLEFDFVLNRFNDRDHTEVELLESAVATWQQQVEGVLRSDPDAALKVQVLTCDGMAVIVDPRTGSDGSCMRVSGFT